MLMQQGEAMAKRNIKPIFIGVESAARLLGITERHVRRLAKKGKLPGSYLKGNYWLIPCSEEEEKSVGLMQSIHGVRDEFRSVSKYIKNIANRIDRIIDIEEDRRINDPAGNKKDKFHD
jgi:excisionase family DNA binding protein